MSMQFVAASSQYLSAASEFTTLRQTFTISFWIKTTQVGSDTAWLAPGVTGIEQAGGNNDIMIGIIDATGHIGINVGPGGDVFNKSTSVINNGNWHHVAITRTQTDGGVQIFINGVLETTATRSTATIGNTFTSIGRVEDTGGTPVYLDGTLDDLRIYDRVLNAQEVWAVYYGRGGGDNITYGLVNRYIFDEGYPGQTDTTAGDTSVRRDVWSGIAGTAVSVLTSLTTYPDSPNFTDYWSGGFEGPTNVMETYGARMYGWFQPNTTANHYFAFASDDNGELWLSTDQNPANRARIAYQTTWAGSRQYTKEAGQISTAISLTSGKWYFIEGLMKENTGGDNIAAAYNLSGTFVDGDAPIPASQLTYKTPPPEYVIDTQRAKNLTLNNSPTWQASMLLIRRMH